MTDLAEKTCCCTGTADALSCDQINRMSANLDGWSVEQGHHLARTYTFPDFPESLAFVNKVGAIAEEQGHHPDIHLKCGEVRVELWTHKIDGLTESDFTLASKLDKAYQEV